VKWRSIGTRLVALTGLVIVATVALVVWRWATTDRARLLDEASGDATSLATALHRSLMAEIDDANWKQADNDLDLVVEDDPKIVYVIVHGDKERAHEAIVASHPDDITGYIPDVVPLEVTRAALAAGTVVVAREAPLLRDVVSKDVVRARRGERVVEAAVAITNASGRRVGTMRVGISTKSADEAAIDAVWRALEIGAAALALALVAAFVVARTLTRPIRVLAADAARLAAGDLGRRVEIERADEIGALATAFNDMSRDLDASFSKLSATAASFERFVPRKFLAVVAPEGIEKIKIGTAAKRRVAVLFSDIRGFTKMAEQMSPLEVFEMLNEYLARMGAAIDAASGFVDKYIGDAIMALFDDDHTDSLLRAIVGMRRALAELNADREARGKPPILSGIGAHGGEVVMGTIGFASKIESTVIGDPVNVASRVEGMTKEHGVSVLVTGEIVARLADRDAFPLRLLASGVSVRGRVDPIDLWTIDA
jgi:class 3 adenylate cyclase